MKHKPIIAVLIVLAVTIMVSFFRILSLPQLFPSIDLFERAEAITYDWRVRNVFNQRPPVAPHLAAVFIDDDSLKVMNERYRYSWPWPRQLYGRLIRELHAQGASVVGFDIIFSELHAPFDATQVVVPGEGKFNSDEFFAQQLRAASNVVLAVAGEETTNGWQALLPAELFRTNTLALGRIDSKFDSDGILRRVVPYRDDPNFGRIWHMGIVMAARELKLDLDKAIIEPSRIILRGPSGVERVIPMDSDGSFLINWTMSWNDKQLKAYTFEDVLAIDEARQKGDQIEPSLAGALVVVGSIGTGNNVSDRGATPLSQITFYVSKHWNVLNSVLTGQFVRTTPWQVELILIALMCILTGWLSWNLRAVSGIAASGALILAYMGIAHFAFVKYRVWVPIVLPVFGGVFLNYIILATYRILFEQREQRRVKGIFSRIVSPDVVNELLKMERISLNGARKELTLFFADVRGFTELTDHSQAEAEEYVRAMKLTGEAAHAYYEEQASVILATVNLYLSIVADQVKKQGGTLDKYIGDCVMAFWGAPTPNPHHARDCVRAAIEAQRAIQALNLQRSEQNKAIEQDNATRAASGLPPRPLLPLLTLGSGINTGVVTVGLMGSDAHILNYTVFGREVNLASRLEGVSGKGRIIIGEATYLALLRDDPELAKQCHPEPPVTVKGFRDPAKIYEVPWKTQAGEALKP